MMANLNDNSSSSILRLPAEMKIEVMKSLPSIRDLRALLTTCGELYETFKGAEGVIVYQVLHNEIGPEVPIAVADYAASRGMTFESWDDHSKQVTAFCNLYLSKQGTELLLPKPSFSLDMARYILEFRQDIDWLVEAIALQTMKDMNSQAAPTATEKIRIRKSFYILDMVTWLCPRSPVTQKQHRSPDISQHDHTFSKFWSYFAPWESMQVYCLWRILACKMIPRQYSMSLLRVDPFGSGKAITHLGLRYVAQLLRAKQFSDLEYHIIVRLDEDPTTGNIRDLLCDAMYLWFKPVLPDNNIDHQEFEARWPDMRHYKVNIDIQTLKRYNADLDTGPRDTWLWTLESWAFMLRDSGGLFAEGVRWKDGERGIDFGVLW
ncbi:hypothetical protein F5B20DRAFT_104370 [Whalleya microplaca]|nr:hypothetical protein F5B20DRAFT_104370 [Whalleya microplaca]